MTAPPPPDRAPPTRASARPHPLVLGFAVLGGPAAWGAHLSLSYYLVPRACAGGTALVLHLVTLATAAVAVAAVVVAGRLRADADADGRDAPLRALATIGVLLGLLFLVATLVEGIPALVVGPCR